MKTPSQVLSTPQGEIQAVHRRWNLKPGEKKANDQPVGERERRWAPGGLATSWSMGCGCTIHGREVTSPKSCWCTAFRMTACAGPPWLRRCRGTMT